MLQSLTKDRTVATSPLRGEVGAQRRVRGSALQCYQKAFTPHPSSATSLALRAPLPSPLRGEGAPEPTNLEQIQ